MDFGPLDMLQIMQTVNVVPPPMPVVPVEPVPFVPGDFSDMWCRNPEGNKVEWSIMYKVPAMAMSQGTAESISNGVQYGYIDSATKLDATVRMRMFYDITSTKDNALYNTLDVLFKYPRGFLNEKNLTFLAYNDRPPANLANGSTNGIAKGVLLFGPSSGAWVVHSLDGFGEFFKDAYIFPEEARRQGQMIMCMSLTSDNWPKIISHLRRETPNLYDWNVLPWMFGAYPDLTKLIEKNFNHDDPGAETNVLTGVNGTDFLSFSKNAIHNYDIFETLVAPGIETNIFVRGTEESGDQHLENFCDRYNLTAVNEVELKMGTDVTFKNIRRSQDNSKWAVAERDYWVCIGSVERKKGHLPRGAEAFCFQNQPANILLANSIDQFASCKQVPDDLAAKIAAAAPGTEVSSNGVYYRRPMFIRPAFGIPRIYYGGLPSFGFGFPFSRILKNPIVVGAAVAGVMHYRHKAQIKKLNAMHAMSSGYGGYGGYPGYRGGSYNPGFGGGAGSKYSSGLAGIFGLGSKKSYPSPAVPHPASAGSYTPNFNPGFGGNPSYPSSGYPAAPRAAYPGSYPGAYPGAGYPSAPHHGYPNSYGSHGYPNSYGSHGSAPHSPYGGSVGAAGGYPSQPAHNPSYNAAKPASPSAPSAPATSDVTRQKSSTTNTGSSPHRPVKVERTVTKTVTTYGSSRGSSGSSRGSSGSSRGSSRGGSRGGGRGGGRGKG